MSNVLSLKKARLMLLAIAALAIGLVSGVPIVDAAETSDECFSFNEGTIVYYDNDPISGFGVVCPADVEIPSKINGVDVIAIGANAFSDNDLTSVTIPNSVTSIGDSAFSNNSLTSVTIPDSVTAINVGAFLQNQLTSVTIPDGVKSIGGYAFAENSLNSVIIPHSVTSIAGGAFSNNNLTSVDIPSSVISIGNTAFLYNSANGDEPYSQVALKVANNNPHGLSSYNGGTEGGHKIVTVAPEPEPEQKEEKRSSSRSSGTRFGCKDPEANNFQNFVAHKKSLCEYGAASTVVTSPTVTSVMTETEKQELIKRILRQIVKLLTAA